MIAAGMYSGKVWHERKVVKDHSFEYKMLMLAYDLDDIDQICAPSTMIKHNQFGALSIRDQDHFGESNLSIKANIEQFIPENIKNDQYRIMMISQLAHFGFAFNPISFFVVLNHARDNVLGVVLEVHNTPWGERRFYPLFDLINHDALYEQRFRKTLHVSPFLPMDYEYHFKMDLSEPKKIQFTLDNWQNNKKHFSASIALYHHEPTANAIKKQFLKHPFSPHKTVLAIYWQALKLWLKRVPLHSHPKWESKDDD